LNEAPFGAPFFMVQLTPSPPLPRTSLLRALTRAREAALAIGSKRRLATDDAPPTVAKRGAARAAVEVKAPPATPAVEA